MNIEFYRWCEKGEKRIYIYKRIGLSVLVCGWRPKKLVTLAASGRGSRWLGMGWEEEFSLYSRLCLFNFRTT